MDMYGKAIVGEEKRIRIPSDVELRSRISQNNVKGRLSYQISPIYGNESDIQDRRK